MLIDLAALKRRYRLPIETIVHVGASEGEELPKYDELGVRKVVWVEPRAVAIDRLRVRIAKYPKIEHVLIPSAAGSATGIKPFYLANNGQSSSILQPDLHLQYHPNVSFSAAATVEVDTLDNLLRAYGLSNLQVDVLNVDVQGYELEVFRGFSLGLQRRVRSVYCEVNWESLYSGCARIGEITSFLAACGFSQLDTHMLDAGWGDAFYLKTGEIDGDQIFG